jgi:predicted RND superfamily exporter protein
MVYSKKKSWAIIITVLIITTFFGFQIPKLVIDNDVKNYLPHDLPDYTLLQESEDIYGSEILMDVALTTNNDSILSSDNVNKIRELTQSFETLENVDKVQSLTNIDYLTSENGGMVASTLVADDFNNSTAEIQEIKEKLVDWQEMYDGVIISKDMRGSQIIITIDKDITPDEMDTLYDQIASIVNEHNSIDLEITMAGDPVLSQKAREYMNTDLTGLIPLVTIILMLCLFFSFKKFEGMILPVITVLISTVWDIGLMALSKAHFTVVSSCLPVVLIAVGSAYGIHVLNHYYEMISKEKGVVTHQKQTAIVNEAVKAIKGPVILAGITTIAGFISTITSPVIPLKTFALYSAIGVTIALVLSLLFIPSLLIVKSLKGENNRIQKRINLQKAQQSANPNVVARISARREAWSKGVSTHIATYLSEQRGRLYIFFVIVVALSVWGISKLNIESAIINYFPEDSSIRTDAKMIDENFAGSNSFNFLVTSTSDDNLTNPEILKQMDDLQNYLVQKYPNEIGKVISYTEFIKRMNQVMHFESDEVEDNTDFSSSSEDVDSFFSDEEISDGQTDSFFSDSGDISDETAFSSDDDFSSFFDEEPIDSNLETESSHDMLNTTATVAQWIELMNKTYIAAGGSNISVDEFYDQLLKQLDYIGANYYEIPYDETKYPVADKQGLKNLISQYLLLYSGSLNDFSNDSLEPTQARMQIELTTHDTQAVANIINDGKAFAQTHFPKGYSIEAYGIAELEYALTDMITSSQITSLLLAILIVFVILLVYFKSPIAGIIGTIPLILSILINFGIMGIAHINLDMVTSLIGSIAIGIGVDYTIHFMDDYHKQRLISNDLQVVTLNTLSLSGKAIIVNAVSVGLGFLVLALSQFVVLRYIGILVAIVMFTSSFTSMTILPALLNTFDPKFMQKSLRKK